MGRRRGPRRAASSSAGARSCARFIDAGDTRGWAHHVLFGGTAGDVEFALGETRCDDGERIGTFLAVAQLDDDGRMVKYMVARSPAIAFEARTASMPQQTESISLHDGLVVGTAEAPELVGSRCRNCGIVAFPRAGVVRRRARRATSRQRRLARAGTLWTWTIQCFAPKSPPYAGGAEDFEPYGVGYVELAGEVRVEARLTESDPEQLRIGMPMELVLDPGARAPTVA